VGHTVGSALRSACLFSGYRSLPSSSIKPPILELTNQFDLPAFCFHFQTKCLRRRLLFLSDTKQITYSVGSTRLSSGHVQSGPHNDCCTTQGRPSRLEEVSSYHLRILLILFVSALSAERSFSKLKIIKIYY